MSESGSDRESHEHLKRVAEASAVVIALGGASASAYLLWQKQHREARTFEKVSDSTVHIFDNEKLGIERRELMSKLAVRIYMATLHSANGVIMRETLCEQLGISKHIVQTALGYLIPQKNRGELAHELAYIDREPGRIDGREGYVSTPRLNQLLENGESEMLNQAIFELTNNQ